MELSSVCNFKTSVIGGFLKSLFLRPKEGFNDDARLFLFDNSFQTDNCTEKLIFTSASLSGLASKCILIKRRFPWTLWFE